MSDEPKFKPCGEGVWQTKSERPVRIYATDGGGTYPIHGAFLTHDGWSSCSWRKDGTSPFVGSPGVSLNLIPVPMRAYFDDHVSCCFAERDAARARVKVLEAALKPFAINLHHLRPLGVVGATSPPSWPDGRPIYDGLAVERLNDSMEFVRPFPVTIGDFRRARAALEGKP
jgi:hypothetical protein